MRTLHPKERKRGYGLLVPVADQGADRASSRRLFQPEPVFNRGGQGLSSLCSCIQSISRSGQVSTGTPRFDMANPAVTWS